MKFQGPGQYHVTGVDRFDEDEVDDDKVALLNLEKNIASIERSMSASQLEKAKHRMEQNNKVKYTPSLLTLKVTGCCLNVERGGGLDHQEILIF